MQKADELGKFRRVEGLEHLRGHPNGLPGFYLDIAPDVQSPRHDCSVADSNHLVGSVGRCRTHERWPGAELQTIAFEDGEAVVDLVSSYDEHRAEVDEALVVEAEMVGVRDGREVHPTNELNIIGPTLSVDILGRNRVVQDERSASRGDRARHGRCVAASRRGRPREEPLSRNHPERNDAKATSTGDSPAAGRRDLADRREQAARI